MTLFTQNIIIQPSLLHVYQKREGFTKSWTQNHPAFSILEVLALNSLPVKGFRLYFSFFGVQTWAKLKRSRFGCSVSLSETEFAPVASDK